jgi:hypothetical protein
MSISERVLEQFKNLFVPEEVRSAFSNSQNRNSQAQPVDTGQSTRNFENSPFKPGNPLPTDARGIYTPSASSSPFNTGGQEGQGQIDPTRWSKIQSAPVEQQQLGQQQPALPEVQQPQIQSPQSPQPQQPGQIDPRTWSRVSPELEGQGLGPTPLMPQEDIDELNTSKLQSTVEAQRGAVERMTGEAPEEKDENPGTLGKVLDILLRPNYMMAEGSMRAQESILDRMDKVKEEGGGFIEGAKEILSPEAYGEGVTEAMKGMWAGLTGKDKTAYADVLDMTSKRLTGEELNPVVRGTAGFVLDVALDPTTYIGGSVIKAASKGSIDSAATRAVARMKESPEVANRVRATAAEKVRRELLEEVGTGSRAARKGNAPKNPKAEFNKRVKEVTKQEYDRLAKDTLKIAKSAPGAKGTFQVKFAGQVIGESEKVYNAVGKAITPVSRLPGVEWAAKAFNPRKELGDARKAIRFHEALSVSHFEDSLRHVEKVMRALPETDRVAISHAIEGSRHLDDPKLLEVKEQVERLFARFFDDEVALGIMKEDQFRDNYLYHFYDVAEETADKYKNKYGMRGKPGFTKERQYVTLEQAKRDGMKPREDIMDIVRARAAKHYKEIADQSIMDDLVENYGLRKSKKGDKAVIEALKENGIELEAVKAARGETAYVPKHIKKSIEDLRSVRAGGSREVQQLLKFMDKSQSGLKFWLTVANPGHHVRNFAGNTYQAWQDGVRDPYIYRKAYKGVRGGVVGADEAAKATAKNTRIKTGNGYTSADRMYQIYVQSGTRSGFMTQEIAHNPASKVGEVIRGISQGREDTARLGHFMDVLRKTAPSDFHKWNLQDQVAFARKNGGAVDRVKKFQVDYADLTNFEKTVARRIMMFYTFARKNTVLQMEMALLRPGKLANTAKATTAIERVLGVKPQKDEDEDFMARLPQWIQEMNAPRIGGNDNIVQKILGTGGDDVFANVLLPTTDLNRIEGPKGILHRLANEVRPEIGIPFEQATGASTFTGGPIPDDLTYAMQQTPITGLVRKIYGHATGDPSGNLSPAMDLSNYLTGITMQRVTPQRQQSELRRQQDPIQTTISEERKKNLEEFLERNRTNRVER